VILKIYIDIKGSGPFLARGRVDFNFNGDGGLRGYVIGPNGYLLEESRII
jgi:hypothetical protein